MARAWWSSWDVLIRCFGAGDLARGLAGLFARGFAGDLAAGFAGLLAAGFAGLLAAGFLAARAGDLARGFAGDFAAGFFGGMVDAVELKYPRRAMDRSFGRALALWSCYAVFAALSSKKRREWQRARLECPSRRRKR